MSVIKMFNLETGDIRKMHSIDAIEAENSGDWVRFDKEDAEPKVEPEQEPEFKTKKRSKKRTKK